MNEVATINPDAGSGSDSTDQCLFALLGAASRLHERLESALAAVGLSSAKFHALDEITRAGGPVPLSELASSLNCVRSNVTQLVDRLEADGLVRRVADAADRRTIRAELTELGAARQAQGADAVRGVRAELGAKLSAAERAALLSSLQAMM